MGHSCTLGSGYASSIQKLTCCELIIMHFLYNACCTYGLASGVTFSTITYTAFFHAHILFHEYDI
jgi:hypothetical protein